MRAQSRSGRAEANPRAAGRNRGRALRFAGEPEQVTAGTFEARAERIRDTFASCSHCLKPLSAYDLLVTTRCPNCKRATSGAVTALVSKRFLHFQHLARLVEDVAGEVVECGVGGGKSLFMLALLTEAHIHPRRLWGFDSFQGLPAPGPLDEPESAPERIKAGKYAFRESEVRSHLLTHGISESTLAERFVFVQGYFPASFPEYTGQPIALLHLDVDLYQSYKDCLEWFEPKVAPGGVITFDEYGRSYWPGATRAIDEYYGGTPPGIQKSPYWSRWFVVKR
jgi:hypothetical protein